MFLTPQFPQGLSQPTPRFMEPCLDRAYFDPEQGRSLGVAHSSQVKQSHRRPLAWRELRHRAPYDRT
jgi:hypothetical protein